MKRWFYDTEFDEDGCTIELISIAMVSDAGDEYYAVSSEFDPERCNDWVKQNVLPKLPPSNTWKPRHTIAREIRKLLLGSNPKNPSPIELWAYFAAYDHVALCQLYGRMVDLPKGMPMFTNDLKQLMNHLGLNKSDLPEQNKHQLHDARADARWVRDAYRWLHEAL